MKSRTLMVSAMVAVVFLCLGCSGGGGGGGGAGTVSSNDVTTLSGGDLNTPLAATLGAGDIVASDGSLMDLYLFDVTRTSSLKVSMQSGAVDSFLFLFTDGCLSITDLDAWEDCLVANGDGTEGSRGDAEINLTNLPEGKYVIGANAFAGDQSGPYTLEVTLN